MFTLPHTRPKADRPARRRFATRDGVHRFLGLLVNNQAVGSVYKVAHPPRFVQPWNRPVCAPFSLSGQLAFVRCRTPDTRLPHEKGCSSVSAPCRVSAHSPRLAGIRPIRTVAAWPHAAASIMRLPCGAAARPRRSGFQRHSPPRWRQAIMLCWAAGARVHRRQVDGLCGTGGHHAKVACGSIANGCRVGRFRDPCFSEAFQPVQPQCAFEWRLPSAGAAPASPVVRAG